MYKSLSKLTDDQLVNAYANGNNNAFDILLNRYQSKVFSYILHIVHNKDITDDIFQETFVKAIMTIRQSRYVSNGKFSAWITRIAHNLIIDYYRQEKSENSMSTDDEDINLLNNKELSEGTIEDTLVELQTYSDIRSLIKELPKSQREVLIMRYYKGLSFKEIADITGTGLNTALGRMRYAILNIRRMAEEKNIMLAQ
jgi:RNA polymerase sigma-70 factor (ECF subfamily)